LEENEKPKRGRGRPRKPVPDAVPARGRGRPKMEITKVMERAKTLREIALPYGEEMVNVLARVAMDDEAPHAARVSAANHLLNRAFGQPAVAAATDADTADRTIERIERVIIDRAEAKAKADA